MSQANETIGVDGDLRAALSALWDIKGAAEARRFGRMLSVEESKFLDHVRELCDRGLSGSLEPAVARPENHAAQALDVMLGLGSWRR